MVKAEIDENLSQIEMLLEAVDENHSDSTKLAQCVEKFQQLEGVFKMISMPGASMLTEVMAKACSLSTDKNAEERYEIHSKISSAIVVLLRYLEYVQASQESLPELLFANINELRIVVKEKPLTESYFFDLELNDFNFDNIEVITSVDDSTRRLRHMYQVGLLGTFKEENLKSNFRLMGRALERLNGLYGDSSPLLRIFTGALASLIEGNVQLTVARKLMFGRIDRQVKALLSGDPEKLNREELSVLIKDCLYVVALADPSTDLLVTLHDEFDLGSFNLNETRILQQRELMTGPGAAVIQTVSGALREEVSVLKDQLDVMARAGDKQEELLGLASEFRKVAHTITMLGLNDASEKLASVLDGLEQSESFEKNVQALADSLMEIEHATLQLEIKNSPLTSQEDPNNRLELDEVFASAVKESRKIIAMVQHALSTFAENEFNISFLDQTVEGLHAAWGGVYFLNIERAANQIQQSANFIEQKLLGVDKVQDIEQLRTLADALASIDYYLEGLEEKKPLGDGALDIAEESLSELGYGSAA